jgi:predicted nucleic acid-binding protein
MSATLVDTNVLLDLATNDPNWADWSVRALDAASIRGALLINDVIYAEFSVRFAAIETLDAFVEEAGLEQAPMPGAGLFLAGKAFQRYRDRGGARASVLPDFFIGAHATILDIPLLTRDEGRYRNYFPKLALITP